MSLYYFRLGEYYDEDDVMAAYKVCAGGINVTSSRSMRKPVEVDMIKKIVEGHQAV